MPLDNKKDEASGDAKKSEIIAFYNSTKSGRHVDGVNMNINIIARNSRRWPFT